jgi:hypothetical protein
MMVIALVAMAFRVGTDLYKLHPMDERVHKTEAYFLQV